MNVKKTFAVLVVVAAIGGGGVAYWRHAADPSVAFRTAPAHRGDLLITIGATGTVEPVEVIDVGAQVAGKIEYFGKNAEGKIIDYGTNVDEGTILAHIDDSLYAADVAQTSAQLEQAKANVLRDRADLEQKKALLHQAENNWKRAQELGPSRALSATDYDSYQATYETAKATVAVSAATIVQSEKSVVQAEASLKRSKTNLDYCTIKSPVKGVIVDRRVNIGQTVVASLNAPSLFLIAKDLTKMQVWASVNEADIGSIHSGQAVSFTVDAFPGRKFKGMVGKVRLNASMTQNVVTYTVEINTDNSDGTLLPYLTANVLFEVAQRKNVLMVPNAALRYKPSSPALVAPDARQEFEKRALRTSPAGGATPAPGGGTPPGPTQGPARKTRGTVWVKDGTFVRPIEVGIGLSDGTMTEIQGDTLKEDTETITGESEAAAGDETTNPFAPRLFGNRQRR